jgi:hypothetical protein
MGALPPVAGIVAGAVVGVIGVGAVLSGDKDDRKPGLAAAVAGGLSILSRIPFVRPLAGVLLGIGAVGLLAIGVWNGIKFLRELKNRS